MGVCKDCRHFKKEDTVKYSILSCDHLEEDFVVKPNKIKGSSINRKLYADLLAGNTLEMKCFQNKRRK